MLVAVSTKAGRVWLWRYQLPLEYSVAADSSQIIESFVLVRSLILSHPDRIPLCPVHAANELSALPMQRSMTVSETVALCGLMI